MTTVSQDKPKLVNTGLLLDKAYDMGSIVVTTGSARACWVRLTKMNYQRGPSMMLYWDDGIQAGAFEFEVLQKEDSVRITYLPIQSGEMDFDPQKEDTDDCSDCDQETEEAIENALNSGVLDPNGPEHASIVKLLGLEVKP